MTSDDQAYNEEDITEENPPEILNGNSSGDMQEYEHIRIKEEPDEDDKTSVGLIENDFAKDIYPIGCCVSNQSTMNKSASSKVENKLDPCHASFKVSNIMVPFQGWSR